MHRIRVLLLPPLIILRRECYAGFRNGFLPPKLWSPGLTRAIGVSNYNVTDLESLAHTMKVRPALNQCNFGVSGFRGAMGSDAATLAPRVLFF